MAKNRYSIGDKVLVSPDESGENHVPGTVVDSYELIIGEDRRPVIVVELEDGERKYMTAETPNVLPVEPEEDDAEEEAAGVGGDADPAEAEAEAEAAEDVQEPAAGESGNGTVVFTEDDELGNP